jgi:tetratricopeptide (TPR) repeat protein
MSRSLRSLLAVVVALVAMLGASTASASPALDAANRSFAEAHYGDAATQYESLVRSEGYSAPLLFDLGNAYLRDDKPALAILSYERARLLAPRDAAIAANLAEARKAAGVADEPSFAHRAAHVLTTNEWTWIAAVAVWLAIAAGAGAWLFPRRRAWLVRAASLGALAGAPAIVALAASSHDLHAALVIRAAPVLVSPFDGAQSSFSLRAGSDLELARVHDGYVLVRDRAGRSGWVERSAVAPLVDGARLGG